jgi:hypothetical protein
MYTHLRRTWLSSVLPGEHQDGTFKPMDVVSGVLSNWPKRSILPYHPKLQSLVTAAVDWAFLNIRPFVNQIWKRRNQIYAWPALRWSSSMSVTKFFLENFLFSIKMILILLVGKVIKSSLMPLHALGTRAAVWAAQTAAALQKRKTRFSKPLTNNRERDINCHLSLRLNARRAADSRFGPRAKKFFQAAQQGWTGYKSLH